MSDNQRNEFKGEMSNESSQENPASDGKRGWYGDPARHAHAGSMGGKKIAQDREYMAEIGRKGGLKVAKDREHMAEIGRKGGLKGKRKRAA
ncbi:MAG: hypothetical protein NT023_21685 [Armatimonadetes bacterium]|nr:hypothetical protein [Armatimonadota bacterium]